jgi:DNA polymerase-3 subunit delta
VAILGAIPRMSGSEHRSGPKGISVKTLKAQLNSERPPEVYLLVGSESLLHDEALQAFREGLFPDPSAAEFDMDLVYGNEVSPEDLAARVATSPFAARRRLVIVRRAEELKGVAQVLGKGTPGHGASVLVLDYSPGKSAPAGLPGTRVAAGPPPKHDPVQWAMGWCRDRCREKGLNLQPDAAECLVGIASASLADIDNEIDKLLLFAEDGRAITREDVEAVVGSRPGETVYALSECVLCGRGPEAARIAEALGLVPRAKEMALAQIGWDLLRLMKLKAALDEGVPRGRLAKAVGIWPRWVREWSSRAQEVSWGWLWPMARALYRADRDVKRGRIDLPRALDLLIAASGSGTGSVGAAGRQRGDW